jgi:molecular chaperone DnaK (HSP70)
MDDTRQVFGIDLGTTYSCVAQMDKFDQAMVLKNFADNNTTPSVVYFGENNNVIVGEEAKEMLKLEPERTVSFVKRSISEDAAYNKPTKFPNGLDPTEISAYILKKIVKDANDAAQNPEPVKKVVITCPAYFGTKDRMRTKQAGQIAGLDVLAVINEPTAAAIAYGMRVQDAKVIMVYDLGGGTFDVTVIRVNGGAITVVATGGDHHLGGVDWDTLLAEYLIARYNKEKGTSFSLNADPKLRNAMLLLAEEQKKRLTSGRPFVNAIISPKDWAGEGESLQIELTREVFDQLTEAKLDETVDKTREVLGVAKEKGFGTIDEVLLVGGSSKMPQIKARVDREFGCDAKLTDPNECVAKGAAIFALNESYSQAMEEYADGERDVKPQNINVATKTHVINVTSKNYGVDYLDAGNNHKHMVKNLIFADTLLDGNCRGEDVFYTMEDNQTGVNFGIFESDIRDENREYDEVELLEKHTVSITRKLPKKTPIKYVYEVDTEGILHVHAEIDIDSYDCTLKLKGIKSADEVKRAAAMVAGANID